MLEYCWLLVRILLPQVLRLLLLFDDTRTEDKWLCQPMRIHLYVDRILVSKTGRPSGLFMVVSFHYWRLACAHNIIYLSSCTLSTKVYGKRQR